MEIYDEDVWQKVDVQDLWVYDKLILSKYLGHVCGPAGVNVPAVGDYVVKPITNIMGMGIGARPVYFDTLKTDSIGPGYFWMEWFKGPHLSIDVVDGKVDVVYEGTSVNFTRFSRWFLSGVDINPPSFIMELSKKYGVVNYETVGGKIIELHLRANPDWHKYKAKELIPVWKGQEIPDNFVPDEDGDRLGFRVIK